MRALARLAAALGHLAVWAAAYATGVAILTAAVAGDRLPPAALAFVALTIVGVYLIDRVKWSDALLDPADEAAHPARSAFLRRRSGLVRAAAAACFAAATGIGAERSWSLALVPAAAAVLIWIYAARRPGGGRPRPKDLPVIKNAMVAAALAGLAGVVTDAWTQASYTSIALASLTLSLIVFGDAILCDLDDAPADAAFGTRTLPVLLGPTTAILIAAGVQAAAVACALTLRGPRPSSAALACLAATTLATAAKRPRSIRDLVDVRLAAVAAGVLVI